MSAWTVKPEALEEARKVLGLKFPVQIRQLAGGPQNMAGKYHGLGLNGPTVDDALDAPAHFITAKSEMTPYMANTCLKHELVHAMQCERYVPENGDYRVANAELGKAFGREMKALRRAKGTTSKALTWEYSKVSFEEEAHTADKLLEDIELIDVTDWKAANNGLANLTDENGRFTFRVDVWRDGKWQKGKRSPDEFVATIYVLAKDEYGAKKFAREECNISWNDSTCDSYVIRPFPKKEEGGKDGN